MGVFLEVPSKASCQQNEHLQAGEWSGGKFLGLDSSHVKLSNCNHNACSVSPVSSESDGNRYLQILTLSLLFYAFAHLPFNCSCIGIAY